MNPHYEHDGDKGGGDPFVELAGAELGGHINVIMTQSNESTPPSFDKSLQHPYLHLSPSSQKFSTTETSETNKILAQSHQVAVGRGRGATVNLPAWMTYDIDGPTGPVSQTNNYVNHTDSTIGSLPILDQSPTTLASPQPKNKKEQEVAYTKSLHWNNPASKLITKELIEFPDDVEHITEVEWADDGPFFGNLAGPFCMPVPNRGGVQSCLLLSNSAKAKRPKLTRTDPCFCEPDLINETCCCLNTYCANFAVQEECGNNCPAGPLCKNKRIQRKQWKQLAVFGAGLKGRGLSVKEHCSSGDFIVEYVGVAVRREYLDRLFMEYKSERMLYIMALDTGVYIDARHRGGIARYINHSCEPNCKVDRWKVRGVLRACVFAIRDIEVGEELSFDYQWSRKRGRALTKCHCGSAICRGTIEVPKDDAEIEREIREELEGLWVEQPHVDSSGDDGLTSARVGKEIMNRVVKVYKTSHDEFFSADVSQYDEIMGQHLLMYRGDDTAQEHWTDLRDERWMLLDESPLQQFGILAEDESYDDEYGGGGQRITRKRTTVQEISLLIKTLPRQSDDGDLSSAASGLSPRPDNHTHASSPKSSKAGGVRNYVLLLTPVKDIMLAKHALFKCSQTSRVHINIIKLTVPRDGADDSNLFEGDQQNVRLSKAYEESEDGLVWKLVVTGLEVPKAIEWLDKVAASIYNGLKGIENTPSFAPLSYTSLTGNASVNEIIPPHHLTEVIIPRIVVDEVKKKFFSLKGYCYNVDVTFSHSDSKSKQFAKMTLSSDSDGDLNRAMEYLNIELTQMCQQASAPLTPIGIYKDLGFLGGELSSNDFRMLFIDIRRTSASTDACEDLRRSTFATTFMESNRCMIWVQAEEDMGRVVNNRVINEAHPSKPRKIYFGVTPSRIKALWGYLKTRILDLTRGVRYMYLGPNKIYKQALIEPIKMNKDGSVETNNFFEFVYQTSGTSVIFDSITGDYHLRLDGGDIYEGGEILNIQVNEKIELAEELINLQIELLRDHHIRKQRWGFGRDWALLFASNNVTNHLLGHVHTDAPPSVIVQDAVGSLPSAASKLSSSSDALRLSDSRAVGTACLEISEIIYCAGLSEKVAAHACIVLYRFINLNISTNIDIKLRDVQLASLFIANKSQKVVKWVRLEGVLEHAYRVFYPGSYFNPQSEEAKNWEQRVIKAEITVLSLLDYDVFWPGVDWVINAVVGTKAMAEPLAENTMALALSGHVLATGPVLWLKYGPRYAFAAVAGLLSIDIEPLFSALSLHPLTVSHAAELIYLSCQALSRVKKNVALQSKHGLFGDSNASLMGVNIQKLQKDCATYISKHKGSQLIDNSKFVSSPAYKEISERSKLRRVFSEIKNDCIEEMVLPALSKLSVESKCAIRFTSGKVEGTNDIVLEGSWKALCIAEHMLCDAALLSPPLPYYQFMSTPSGVNASLEPVIQQVKDKPGLLDMKKIGGKHGWYGTFEMNENNAGWKTCVAAYVPQEHIDLAGLRWWVPNHYGPSLSGSLCEIFTSPKLIKSTGVDKRALALLVQSFSGGYTRMQAKYPTFSSFLTGLEGEDVKENDRLVPISLQRWPPEKIDIKERSTEMGSMQMGYSPAALQEMQLLHELHFLIPSPQGHPNFVLPLAIALDSNINEESSESFTITSNTAANDILVMIERNQRAAGNKQLASGSYLVLEPTPLNLQKIMSSCHRKNHGGPIIPSTVLESWCHDILSAISFCHSNHIILRSFLPDQIHIDHSGTAKLSGLSKVMILHGKDRTKEFDPLKFVRSKKRKDHNTEDVEPYAAPELLLGGTRYTKQTDMWAFGALLANLLLGKQLFPGRDRVSKMTQVFKIVGIPDIDNYEEAKEFPFYSSNMFVIGDEGKMKKYPRGVEKALHALLGANGNNAKDDFASLFSLIDSLLHLDPTKRMTANEALRHQYMMNHSAHIESQEFCHKYVHDWLDLKENVLMRKSLSKSNSLDKRKDRSIARSKFTVENEVNKAKQQDYLISTSIDEEDGDDLYDFSSKKLKSADN